MSLKIKVVKKVVKYALRTKRGKRLFSEAQKLINKQKSKLQAQLSVKAVHKDIPLRVKSEKAFTKTKFQKPKHISGGRDDTSLRTATHYGLEGKEFKVASGQAKRAIWHDTRARGSESWRAEMSRVFGGEHMAQSGIGLKRSLKKLHKQIASDIKKFKKKKIKKATEGGEVVIHDNVDRSLL